MSKTAKIVSIALLSLLAICVLVFILFGPNSHIVK